MSKSAKKNSKLSIVILSLLTFIIGLLLSAFVGIVLGRPDSYEIPSKVSAIEQVSSGQIDVDIVKSKELSIHFIELGNKYTGDCTLIKVGDVEILIDAGSRTNSVPTIKNYLDKYIEGELDYIIVTHAHQDHYAGFATPNNVDGIFDLYEVETVIEFAKTNQSPTSTMYSNYQSKKQKLVERCNTNVYTALDCVNEEKGAKREYDLGNDVKLQILYQQYYELSASTENNYSVCCQIVQGGDKYYMFTGDLEKEGEISLVNSNHNSGYLHHVELYKAGHHGSKTSSSNELLSVIQPKNVCVCCCAGSSEYTSNNVNQFPTQEFVNRIAPYTQNVFVTTLCVDYKAGNFKSMNGNIVVFANKLDDRVTINCENNAIILKDTEWFMANRTMPESWAA